MSLGTLIAQRKTEGITVTGVGVVSVSPNRTELVFEIMSKDEKAVAALETNNKKIQKTIEALRKSGIPDSSISTSNFYVRPQTEYPERGKQGIMYFVASSTLKVQLLDIMATGVIIDKLVSEGATSINEPIFSVINEDSLKAIAYKKAVEDAYTKARKLADSFGVKLGRALQVNVDMYDVEPRKYYRSNYNYSSVSALQTGTVIKPYDVTKQVKVDVTFDILNLDDK